MKRVFVVHGWEGTPDTAWFPWIKAELEKKGFEVIVPELPDTNTPRIDSWIPKLKELVKNLDGQTYFIGHSMGCQTIARFLEDQPEEVVVGGVVFVAGFFKRLTGLEDYKDILGPWLNTPLDLDKVKKHIKKSVAIFSDNDQYVPLDNQDDFKDKLGSEIVQVSGMQHMGDSYKELPIALGKLLEISSS